jgi:hypothetical protein
LQYLKPNFMMAHSFPHLLFRAVYLITQQKI